MHAKKNYSAKSSAGGTAMVTEVNCPVSEAMVPWWKIKYSSNSLELQNSFRNHCMPWYYITMEVPRYYLQII